MRISALVLALAIAGCAQVQTHERLAQDQGRELGTYVGGQVMKVQRSSDLPNAVGRADLFGGKVDRGFTEVRYQGLAQDGKAVFAVVEVETVSNETTMSRRPMATSNVSVMPGTQSATITTVMPRTGSTQMLPANSTQFAVDLSKTKDFVIAGYRIRIVGATETALRYTIEK